MRYTGPSEEEAIKKFGEKFRAEFPGLTCSAWRWKPTAE